MASVQAERMLAAAIEYFAEHGVEDRSLRAIAAAIGTTHRMIIYHFGSREGLLAAVVGEVEARQRDLLTELTGSLGADGDPRTALLTYWDRVLGAARVHGPLFFELSVHAMHDQPHARSLQESLVGPWIAALTELLDRLAPIEEPGARAARARLALAVARGLIHDVLVTGDVEATTAAMTLWIDLTVADSPSAAGRGSG
jgi:AcrR family transcriptional regulator